MTEFKVGDRVRVNTLVGRDEDYGVQVGDEFTITSSDDYYIEGHPIRYMAPRQLELVVEEETLSFTDIKAYPLDLKYLLDLGFTNVNCDDMSGGAVDWFSLTVGNYEICLELSGTTGYNTDDWHWVISMYGSNLELTARNRNYKEAIETFIKVAKIL